MNRSDRVRVNVTVIKDRHPALFATLAAVGAGNRSSVVAHLAELAARTANGAHTGKLAFTELSAIKTAVVVDSSQQQQPDAAAEATSRQPANAPGRLSVPDDLLAQVFPQ